MSCITSIFSSQSPFDPSEGLSLVEPHADRFWQLLSRSQYPWSPCVQMLNSNSHCNTEHWELSTIGFVYTAPYIIWWIPMELKEMINYITHLWLFSGINSNTVLVKTLNTLKRSMKRSVNHFQGQQPAADLCKDWQEVG